MSAAPRFILHVDMDAFYASVEQRDNPELRGKPVAVGGSSARGVVAAASYEARAFGVHSALSSRIALSRCPELTFVKPRFAVYKAVSAQIREVFARYTELIEPLSLDEAYLDISTFVKTFDAATDVARAIKRDIRAETGLNATAGVAAGKFLAKLASGMNKPDGLTVIRPEEAPKILAELLVIDFHGIGPATAKKMNELGIYTGADLAGFDESRLLQRFGKRGAHFHRIANNIDERPVRPDRIRKSISAERTFDTNYVSAEELIAQLPPLVDKVYASLERLGRTATGVVVKVKFRDHTSVTRQTKLRGLLAGRDQLREVAAALLRDKVEIRLPVRLLGVGVTGLGTDGDAEVKAGETLRLF